MERDSLDADLDRWQNEQDEDYVDPYDLERDRVEWNADNCDFED